MDDLISMFTTYGWVSEVFLILFITAVVRFIAKVFLDGAEPVSYTHLRAHET